MFIISYANRAYMPLRNYGRNGRFTNMKQRTRILMIDNDDKVFTTVSRSEYFHYFDFRFIDNPKYALDLSDADELQ